jgi:sulfite exporter TauE/SafE/plastocyanin domain-containing protein/copper chaperone CopZ
MSKQGGTRERTYYVEGMNCPACEIVIEKKLFELKAVRAVDASTSKSRVVVEYEGQAPGVGQLNDLFKSEGYSFMLSPPAVQKRTGAVGASKIAIAVIVSIVLIVLLQKAGLTRLVTENSQSSLPAFLLLGLVAGFSTCAALVGGIVLSMSKQWGEIYSPDDPFKKRAEPHLLFNTGRLIAFAGLGAVLALIGGTLRLTPTLAATLVIAISLMMILLALQMLGVKFAQRFQLRMPGSVTRYVADEKHFKGRYMPFAMGALTFFLPCGFALTAQSFALLSGKPLQGALIMLFFALGTLPMLLIIGLSSVKFMEKPKLAMSFLKVAGILVLFFALFNINNQLVVLNAPNLGDLFSPSSAVANSASTTTRLPQIVGGKQVLEMEASASGYSPADLTVRAGVPVEWRIKDTGTSGCTNAIISKDLFSGQIALTPGRTSTRVFTAGKPGLYRFSCWMGMVTGTINAVKAETTAAAPEAAATSQPASSGLPAVTGGTQVLRMDATSSGYSPNHLKVRLGIPVRWEITDKGATSCTSAIKTVSLFPDQVQLKLGGTVVKEFTPTKVGRFKFTCWMGMVSGVVDVVDPKSPDRTKFDYDESTVPTSGGCCG